MSTTAADDTVVEEAVVTDAVREAIAKAFADELGDAFLDQHITPGRDLWIRVDASAWVQAATFARDKLGMNWLDYISAIDWLPNPYGREMDAEQDWVEHGGGHGILGEHIDGHHIMRHEGDGVDGDEFAVDVEREPVVGVDV